MMLLSSAVLTLLVVASVNAHNPPGVPPRHDQQQQFQQQQMNVQEGQGQGHGGHHGGNKLKFQTEIHNADHILEHLQNVIKTKPKEQMSEEELEFHYFKMHDYDNNNKLDGVEIGKALTHFHDEHENAAGEQGQDQEQQQANRAPPKIFTDDEISSIVDSVIGDNDENGDGYVEYFEFKRNQEKQRQQYQNQQQNQQQQQQQQQQQNQPGQN
ncbi:multiple coagulation factor deficiency protein 2 homolog isoform X4 [Babylonia areolata]|uniref:multiple coagulation factor deficiency protein 2 homolog isoform X4 n=1 Tax=Babylonia areolata TaxID=304850 RepID=UPI003FD4E49F